MSDSIRLFSGSGPGLVAPALHAYSDILSFLHHRWITTLLPLSGGTKAGTSAFVLLLSHSMRRHCHGQLLKPKAMDARQYLNHHYPSHSNEFWERHQARLHPYGIRRRVQIHHGLSARLEIRGSAPARSLPGTLRAWSLQSTHRREQVLLPATAIRVAGRRGTT